MHIGNLQARMQFRGLFADHRQILGLDFVPGIFYDARREDEECGQEEYEGTRNLQREAFGKSGCGASHTRRVAEATSKQEPVSRGLNTLPRFDVQHRTAAAAYTTGEAG